MIGGKSFETLQRRILRGAAFQATRQREHSPVSERAASRLATRITRRNENARLSATSALVLCYRPLKNVSVSSQAAHWPYQLHRASLEAGQYTSQRVASTVLTEF